jgi:macrolide transport system ATP-binding/permease protein
MLVAAGLFARTLSNLQSIQLGFNRQNVLLFRLNARQAGHRDPEIISFYRDLQDRFSAIPGVRAASASNSPLLGEGTWAGYVLPVGQQGSAATNILMTTPGFFQTMQIPVLLGRPFDERDQPGSQPVAIVSETYVKRYFPNQNPIGQHIVIERSPPLENQEVEIVGVAKNARYGTLKGEFPDIAYLPFNQGSYVPVEDLTFALRTSGDDPLRFLNSVRSIVNQADARIPVTDVRTQAVQIDQIMNQEIIFARLCGAFAILALLIACVGLYGTMSYTVARRTSEIGIRMALGAQRSTVVWMVLNQAFVLGIAGLAIGVPTALTISRFVQSFLFGVKPNSPSALILPTFVLLAAVLLAGYGPARRASRIDPMTAVRHE